MSFKDTLLASKVMLTEAGMIEMIKRQTAYLNAIDGAGREDLFYGYQYDNQATPPEENEYMLGFLDICEQNNVEVLVTDYCFTEFKMDDSYSQNHNQDFISFAAPERELNIIPTYPVQPFNVNTKDINYLSGAKNFLYLINTEHFPGMEEFINIMSGTNYDLLLIDCFYEDMAFTVSDIQQLKTKKNGGKRLVISYLSIGEAEAYRYYWNHSWNNDPPEWLREENPDWPGNYKVSYWDPAWQAIIYGNDASYLKIILNAGFDGVYLDIIDAFELIPITAY